MLFFCVVSAVASSAHGKESLRIEALEQGNVTRLQFFCQQPVAFTPTLHKQTLTITFGRNFEVDFNNITEKLPHIFSSAVSKNNGKILLFTLAKKDQPFTLKRFIGEDFVGVDLAPLSKQALQKARKQKIQIEQKLKEKKEKEQQIIKEKEKELSRRLLFPWNEKGIEATVFTRGKALWVIFDRYKKFDLRALLEEHASVLKDGVQINNRYYTILRFELTRPLYTDVGKIESDWVVNLKDTPQALRLPISIAPEYRSPPGPYLLIKSFPDKKPLTIIDPLIGDQFMVLTLRRPSNGIAKMYKFVDFTVFSTGQGIALELISDNVKLSFKKEGLEITSPSLSLFREASPETLPKLPTIHPEEPEIEIKEETDPQQTTRQNLFLYTIFPFNEWHSGDNSTYSTDKQFLEHSIIFDSMPETVSKNRLDLVHFFIANNMASEAKSLIQYMETIDPPFMQTEPAKRAKALTLYMLDRYKESYSMFLQLTPKNEQEKNEIHFWQNALKTLLDGRLKSSPNYYPYRKTFLTRYPIWLRQKLLLNELHHHIQNDQLDSAEALVNIASGINTNEEISNDINFYQGQILAKNGDIDDAMKLWKTLAEDIGDPRNRARAEFATMEYLFRQNKITREETINRLNKIRYMWRGDDLELNVLKILGQLYIDNKEYSKGLRVWKNIVTYFPNSPDALFIAKRIIQTFVYLFNQGGTNELPPLEALAFYYEFKEWTPIGKPGEIMMKNLVNYLYKMDLLDQASAILTHQVRYRLHGAEKIRVGAKLALIHLLNKKPDLALEVLNAIKHTDTDQYVHIAMKRKYLKAQALLGLKRYDDALKVLDGDPSATANSIRQDIYWQSQQWDKAADILMPNVNTLSRSTAMLTFKESNELLRLAVIRSLQNNWTALDRLYRIFKDRVPEEHNHKKLFGFFAGNLAPIAPQNLDATLQLDDFQSFLDSYQSGQLPLDSIAEDS